MLIKTHLAIIALFILAFVNSIQGDLNKIIFVAVALVATALPDIDSGLSTLGNGITGRIIQFFVKHRGFLHSFTICVILSIILAAFIPRLAFPFFLGYSIHLLSDSFTKEGIAIFWPMQKRSAWIFSTGGVLEKGVFYTFLVLDVLILIYLIFIPV